MKNAYISVLSISVFASLASGCVIHTTVKDAARANVHFATPEAAQKFYDAYISAADPKKESVTVAVYLPMPYWRRTVSTDNIRFNSASQLADSNHDKIISEEEAHAFAARQLTCKLGPSSASTQRKIIAMRRTSYLRDERAEFAVHATFGGA